MKYFGQGLSERHKELNRIIRRESQLETAISLFLEIHGELHPSGTSGGAVPNEVDRLLGDLAPSEYAVMPTAKDETIAWALWHIARIEDLTVNMLAARGSQVFDRQWRAKLNAPITDTGNALSDDQIMELSRALDPGELLRYRREVGLRTRDVVRRLTAGDMRRKVDPGDLARVLAAGGVTGEADSVWLLDFWGQKDVAGILLMPPTRHAMLHLNDCCKWKEHIRAKRKVFRS